MIKKMTKKLIIAISSRALFDLDASNEVYEKEGVIAYAQYQIKHENDVLEPGVAFSLVKKLLNLNCYGDCVEVLLLSRNSADTGLRVFNSIQHYGLDITRAAFTSGESTHQYAKSFGAHLFLSANSSDVKETLLAGCAAATILPTKRADNLSEQLRIAFDGDSVLFSDEAEQIYRQQGLEAFSKSEQEAAFKPLPCGPLHGFLTVLHDLQQRLPHEKCQVRTALVTARSAPAHERVIRTFRAWGVRIDEALFLGGEDKGAFLLAFNADIFFDDQQVNCISASRHVATGHVPHGIRNMPETDVVEQ
jgi:5'-nucleotidase